MRDEKKERKHFFFFFFFFLFTWLFGFWSVEEDDVKEEHCESDEQRKRGRTLHMDFIPSSPPPPLSSLPSAVSSVAFVDSFGESSSELGGSQKAVLAAWSRQREVAALFISDSDEIINNDDNYNNNNGNSKNAHRQAFKPPSLEDVVEDDEDDEMPLTAPRMREEAVEEEDEEEEGENQVVDRKSNVKEPLLRRLRVLQQHQEQEADEILSSSQNSPCKPAPVAVSSSAPGNRPPPAASRFAVPAAGSSAQTSVMLLNRVTSVRKDEPPRHRLWILCWTPHVATEGGEGRAVVQDELGVTRGGVTVFSRHARHADVLCGAWLQHSSHNCACAVSSTAVILCDGCSLSEDFSPRAAPPEELCHLPVVVHEPLPRVTERISVVSAAGAAAGGGSSRSATPARSAMLQRSNLVVRPGSTTVASPAGWWHGVDDHGRSLLLQVPAVLGALVKPVIIRPAPGLGAVRRELLGMTDGPALVYLGLLSTHFTIVAEE